MHSNFIKKLLNAVILLNDLYFLKNLYGNLVINFSGFENTIYPLIRREDIISS
jgi:hypothetical protein